MRSGLPAELMTEKPANEEASQELPSYDTEDDAGGGRLWLRGWRLAGILVVLVVIVGAVVGGGPLYREVKARRALAVAEKAAEAWDRGDSGGAAVLARQAALLGGGDERVEGAVAFLAARAGSMDGVAKLGKRVSDGKASAAEILVFGERSLLAGGQEEAGRALAALPAEMPVAQAVRREALAAALLQAAGKPEEAMKALREAIGVLPVEDAAGLRVMLATILLNRGGQAAADEAGKLLGDASGDPGADGALALRLLTMQAAGQGEGRDAMMALIGRLREHPASSAADELFIARMLVSTDAAPQGDVVRQLVRRLKEGGAPLEDRVAAAYWLAEMADSQAVLEILGAKESAGHLRALMVRLEALRQLGRWEESEALLAASRGKALTEAPYLLLHAHTAGLRGDAEASEADRRELRQVMKFADPSEVLFIARYAEPLGWKPEAFAAWRMLAVDIGRTVESLRGQLRNLPPTSSADEGVKLAEALLAQEPEDSASRLSLAYFQMLRGGDEAKAAEAALAMLEADPDSPDVRRVAALAFLRRGEAERGLQILPAEDGLDRWRALRCGLLHAVGRRSEAQETASKVSRDQLLPEEAEFLYAESP